MSYGRAFGLVMVAALLSSTNGLFVHWMGAMEPWTLVFWRHAVLAAAMLLVLTIWYRRRLPGAVVRMGRVGALGCACFGASGILFMLALRNAPVADVVFLLGAVPPLTALIARLALGERIMPATWVAMVAALCGMGVMVAGSLGGANMTGVLLAAGNACVVAGFAVVLRWGRAIDMLPLIAMGALIAAVASAPLAFPAPWPDGEQVLILLLWCGAIAPVYYTLFVVSSRRLPGGELMLSLPTETIEAVLLAWIVLGQVPSSTSLLGGGIVVAAVTSLALLRLRQGEPRAPLSA